MDNPPRASFLSALGIKDHNEVGEKYERDAFKGGDGAERNQSGAGKEGEK